MSTYAIEIADRVLELLKAPTADEPTPFFKSYWRTPMRQVAASDLPLLGVYILRETRGPDGDENAGEIRFIHRLHLGIAGAISNADPGEQLRILEERMAGIDERLLTNPAFVCMIEGVTAMDRRSQYAQVAETPVAEIQIEMVVTFRTYWEPVVPDDFKTMHVETRYPTADADPAEVQQITQEYDIPQDAKGAHDGPQTPGQGRGRSEIEAPQRRDDPARGFDVAGRSIHAPPPARGRHHR
ncbi:hypothetical protein ACVIWV_006189 [Bradyrhizobium diazoefficiens]|uniref:Uncharacterized protein n=1 Tax=Bradyrhizobium diazoefficiens TaxID=1355477 RepID=A0A0E4FYA8_9BRAD|nr:hypothetical protein [Bradyrhizobium diazoefficiens]MBR0864321.1 hypothetical protein [Bradyrhizobium diazoefficiens]MBR0888897.1 hypothetical protein [Bradyrhizobium diazoefficiens]MBR0920602.1 hypothetical protein [Bradyrhizobium diazoefficiens]WLA66033.1 hypothetical protein QNN01_03970 [Bradyrhizobium diazoefficiens]BAR57587.1 hypothetical protein NK6_4419 [Bradyrhizobium diazoefficiens]